MAEESREEIYLQALRRIANSSREGGCSERKCSRFHEAPLSRALQRIARDAIRKALSSKPAGR